VSPDAVATAAGQCPSGIVGRAVERADGRSKLAGKAEFTADIRVPGMLYGAVLRSPVAHARLLAIDTSAAENVDGVAAVLTGADLSDLDPYYGHALRDRPIVAIDRVRFVGEPVAVIAATTQAAADFAVTRVDVDYGVLPIAASLEAALDPGAPLIHTEPTRPDLPMAWGGCPTARPTSVTAMQSNGGTLSGRSAPPRWS